ncbi:MAG: cyclic nucleotide-binding domain-containing protein [Deltaproteobacteria bacterium]|nr:cyclic nucleotide-binding domain-containing protein [Deltaproteobacteria bacterium]
MGAVRNDEGFESMTTMALDASAEAVTEDTDRAPSLCEPYTDLGLVARGGMGAVRRALDRPLGRHVAVKLLHDSISDRPDLVQRFVLEAQITGALEHPNIVPVHLLGEGADGLPCFSMKLVEGRTLRAEILDPAGLPWPSGRLDHLVQVLLKVCDAVAFAHSRGVVHCDIKPENIMVGEFGQVYLMDWGVARVIDPVAFGRHDVLPPERLGAPEPSNQRVHIYGTPAYMAPEQAIGLHDAIDERTDVYLLGAVLYEMLTGKAPHSGDSLMAVVWQAASGKVVAPREQVPQLDLPEGLCLTAMRALSSVPGDRYQRVVDFRSELELHLRSLDRFPRERFAPGARVVTEGETGEAAYIIVAGRCEVFREVDGRRVTLRQMGPGEVFGETAVFTEKPRTANVEAIDELTVMRVTRELLIEQIGLYSHAGAFVRALAERFRQVDAQLGRLERDSMLPSILPGPTDGHR